MLTNVHHPAEGMSSKAGDMKQDAATLAHFARPASQAANAIGAIKDYILQSNLQPGDALPTEAQMCESLGISRSSVREAIRTLSALDIVEVRHGYGMFVGRVSMQPMVESLVFRGILNQGDDFRVLNEIVEVRQALDLAFAPAVVAAWDGRRDEALHAAVAEMRDLALNGEPFPEQDRFFHSNLLAPLGNVLFVQLTEAFWDIHTLTAPRLGVLHPEDISITAQAHGDMLAAAEAGKVDAYQSAVREHYAPLIRNLAIAREARRSG